MLRGVVYSSLRIGQNRSGACKLIGLSIEQNNANRAVYNSFGIVNCRFMAGHSKWQNVKHVKAGKDREKGLLCSKYSYMVRSAVKESGSDPKLNRRLADLIEQARSHNVPYSTLENAMKKASSGKMKSGLIEILGPGGCYILIDYETDNISTMRYEIKTICKKYNVNISPGEGRWRAFYEQKGILKVTRSNDGQNLDAEKALDVAIEAGAEDVQLQTCGEGEAPFLEFYCEPADLYSVKKEIEQSHSIEDAYVGFIPNVTVELADDVMDVASNLCADLSGMAEVVRLYDNVQ